MFGALKNLMKRGKGSPAIREQADQPEAVVPGLSRDTNGHLKPSAQRGTTTMAGQENSNDPETGPVGGPDATEPSGNQTAGATSGDQAASAATPPPTGALNQQVVQAAEFSNYENAQYVPTMVATPPELMVGQTTGLAVQDAANYMNAIMQIAVAAQAVAIKKAAEGPVSAAMEIPLMSDIQKMVTQAVTVYGTVSTTAGSSSKTVISDFKTGS